MGLNNYTDKPRKDGYSGIRVWHRINGKLKQWYFRSDQLQEAEAFEIDIVKQFPPVPREKQHYNYTAERYDPPKRTSVVGITIDCLIGNVSEVPNPEVAVCSKINYGCREWFDN